MADVAEIAAGHPRWSGYATQSLIWRRGYDWAYSEGPQGQQADNVTAAEAWGYEWLSPDFEEFARGIDFAQMEIERDQAEEAAVALRRHIEQQEKE